MMDIQLIDDCSDFISVEVLTPKAKDWVSNNLTVFPDERVDDTHFKVVGDEIITDIKKMLRDGLSVKLDDDIVTLNEDESLIYTYSE